MLSTVGSDRSCRTYNSKAMKLVLIGIRNELLILLLLQLSKTYKCTLNMEGHGKSKSAGKKKKVEEKENKKKEEETENKKQEGEEALKLKSPKSSSVKEVEDEKEESGEKKKRREDQSVRLFHDDTFKGLSLKAFLLDPIIKQCAGFFRRLSWSNDGELLVGFTF